jgi:signal transduction histidine kinase/ligand-binding sensor domain-containing protein
VFYCVIKPLTISTRALGRFGVLAFWCALMVFVTVPEVSAQYRFDSWTTENGLPHKAVHALLQTRDGYLWLATTDGLVRFDGLQFTIFDTTGGRGFKSNRCWSLFEDRRGDLWVGTEDTGVMRYRDGRFTTYTTADGLPQNSVRMICETAAGDLIVLTDGGAAHWRETHFVPYLDNLKLPPSWNILDQLGGIWYSAGNSIRRATPQGTTAYPLHQNLGPADIASTFHDRQGGIWFNTKETGFGAAQRGLYYLKDGKTTIYTQKDGLAPTAIKCFYEDREGNLWMGTLESGLLRLRDGHFTRYTTADGLSSNHITTIYQDREGVIWIGTLDNGFNRISRKIITTYSTANGLAVDNTYPIYEDAAGVMWVGGWSGLTKIENGKFTHYADKDGLIGLHMSLFKDREGTLWIGSFTALTRMRDGRFELMSGLERIHKINLPDSATMAIHQDREGHLWFGTVAGLVRYRDGATTLYTTNDGLPDKFIQTIYESRDGTLWIGTRSGLARFDGGRFVAITEAEGLSGARVRSLYEDDEGVLWIGTYDGGLMRMKHGQFTRYTIKDGLFNNGAFQILEDHRGNLWMSCNKGIYFVNKQELNDFAADKIHSITSISYDKKDGMLDEECNGGMQPAGCRARDGRLWFPTQKGVAVVDPEAVPRNAVPPPVMIEEFLIQRQPVEFGEMMEITPDKNDFEIHYTGLSFIKSEYVKFRYQLVGLDRDWIDAGTRRAVYYSHLPPGDYTFRVIAANSDGVWNMAGAEIRIRCLPPFYRTWWFMTMAITVVATGVLLAYRRRILQLQRDQLAQEAFSRRLIESQEQERKRIAAELHDSLGQNLLIIKNRALLGRVVLEKNGAVGEQFDEISESASQAIDEVREIAYNLRPHHLDRLGLTKTLEIMIDRAAAASSISFTSRIDDLDGALSKPSESNLYRIVQECINNILRHSQATESEIDIQRNEHGAQIRISDNGRGFSVDTTETTTHRGFGLTGISERVRLLGGTLSVQSGAGQGTRITIKLPLHNERAS